MPNREPQSPSASRGAGKSEAMSTLEFYRQLFAPKPDPAPGPEWPPRWRRPEPGIPGGRTVEEYCRQLAASKAETARSKAPALVLGPRPGLTLPVLPADCRRIRGGDRLLSWVLAVRSDGRIVAKEERLAGMPTDLAYEYDPAGHLLRVWRNGRLAEEYAYDARGARIADWTPGRGPRSLEYDGRSRLVRVGAQRYAYAPDGTLRRVTGEGWQTTCWYGRNLALARAMLPDGGEVRYASAPDGRLLAKYRNGRLVERYAWESPTRLAAWRDEARGEEARFLYREGRRTPYALEWRGPGYNHLFLLGCDQVGSLKVVANQHGAVLKTLDWDSFGNPLADSNPEFFLPLGFAGGLVDCDTGQVRFGRRDYMPSVGRFTAQDPLGDTGGDHDPYDYCVDDPVGRVDPTGLQDAAAPAAGGGGILDGIGDFFTKIGDTVGNWFTGSGNEPTAAQGAAASGAASPAPSATPAPDGGKAAGADRKEPAQQAHPDSGTSGQFEGGYLDNVEALTHYMGGTGDPMRFDLKHVDPSNINPETYSSIQEHLARNKGNVSEANIDESRVIEYPGAQRGYIGHAPSRVKGSLRTDESGWEFDGELLPAGKDTYNFDPKPWGERGIAQELSTWAGSMLPGKEYDIAIEGSNPVKWNGKWQ